MRLSSAAIAFALAAISPLGSFASPILESRADGVSQSTYDDLVRYTKYSSAVYQWICPQPLGNKLVKQVHTILSATRAILLQLITIICSVFQRRYTGLCGARRQAEGDCRGVPGDDGDHRRLGRCVIYITLPFCHNRSLNHADLQIILRPLKSQGLTDVGDAHVHSGFLFAYNAVVGDVLSSVKSQVASYPGYTVVSTGINTHYLL